MTASSEILKEACLNCGLVYNENTLESEISYYGSVNSSEAVAEACSGGTTNLCKEIEKLMRKKWRW